MGLLVLLRHGQSIWNKKNIFTGWVDVPLSKEGIDESIDAGEKIANINFDIVFTSNLIRAQMTGFIALSRNKFDKTPVFVSDESDKWREIYSVDAAKSIIPVYRSYALNERYYGELQGKNKDKIKSEVGEEQFKLWRRSYNIAPPGGESLEMTVERAIPYFKENIIPHLKNGKNILVAAHGNSLRGIVMFLDKITNEEIPKLDIPTGVPLFYHQDKVDALEEKMI